MTPCCRAGSSRTRTRTGTGTSPSPSDRALPVSPLPRRSSRTGTSLTPVLPSLGANYQQLPVNAPLVPIANFQRDGPQLYVHQGARPNYQSSIAPLSYTPRPYNLEEHEVFLGNALYDLSEITERASFLFLAPRPSPRTLALARRLRSRPPPPPRTSADARPQWTSSSRARCGRRCSTTARRSASSATSRATSRTRTRPSSRASVRRPSSCCSRSPSLTLALASVRLRRRGPGPRGPPREGDRRRRRQAAPGQAGRARGEHEVQVARCLNVSDDHVRVRVRRMYDHECADMYNHTHRPPTVV